jgi:Ca2+-binding RTX toxin-like protein
MFLVGKAGRDVLKGGAGDDILYGFGGDDSLSGGGGSDVLAGHEGNDSLNGGTGDDYLLGGAGTDILDGGAGVDWAAYEDATSAVKVSLALTGWQETGGGGRDKLSGIENLYGSAFNDTLIGDAGVNYLSGGAGDDRLEGGAGDDHLEGGRGNDTIIGGDGWDVVSYDDASGAVDINLANGQAWLAAVAPDGAREIDTLIGIEDVYGSRYNDWIVGDANDNYLIGNNGDDALAGSAGNDTLDGGDGNDYFSLTDEIQNQVIYGGDGVDTIHFTGGTLGQAGISIDLDSDEVQTIAAGKTVKLQSVEIFSGTMGNDTVHASSSANEYHSGWGNDLIVFSSIEDIGVGSTSDTVFWARDFKLDVSAIDADVTTAGHQAFRFSDATAFSGARGEIIQTYDLNLLRNIVQFDLDGDKVADAQITIVGDGVTADTFIL